MNSLHFDTIGHDYATFVTHDPVRNDLHYPAVMEALKPISNLSVLDIGCGNGAMCSIIGNAGAPIVYGVDVSPGLIREAIATQISEHGNLQFLVSDIADLNLEQGFDYVTSVMVLPYAQDRRVLEVFFARAYRHLETTGRFISIVFNPEFLQFSEIVANRRFVKATNSLEVQVQFLNPLTGKSEFTSVLKQFSTADYEESAKKAGFKVASWENLHPIATSCYPADLWQRCVLTQPYAMLSCDKS